jgi:hypothetical protein
MNSFGEQVEKAWKNIYPETQKESEKKNKKT